MQRGDASFSLSIQGEAAERPTGAHCWGHVHVLVVGGGINKGETRDTGAGASHPTARE
jgi:hypothetical protein